MALLDQIEIGAVWTDTSVRGSNDVGTVVVSAALSGTGEELADEYNLIVSARAGALGTVTISALSSNNPYHGRVTANVDFDDVTANIDVLPGTSIIFDNAAIDADEATIEVGVYHGTIDASGVGAGVPTGATRHRVTNNGANAVSDAEARLLNQAIHIDKTGRVFALVAPFAENSTEKIAGGGSNRVMPYSFEVIAVTGVGATLEADIEMDGAAVGVDFIQDLSDSTLNDGTGLKALDPPHLYQFVDGPLEGVIFAISADVVNGDTANILIFPSRYVQIAADAAGTPGTYGITDVNLTQVGEATGVILAAGVAYYWTRILVPASANNESNPYPGNVAIQASESQDAGWGA